MEAIKINSVKQLKELLDKLEQEKPIMFKTIENIELEFYTIQHGGIIHGSDKSYEIQQGIIFKVK